VTLELVSSQVTEIIEIDGELDSRSRRTLADAVASCASVLVDLAGLQSCDDGAIRAFLAADVEAKRREIRLEFRHVLPTVRHAFERNGIDWRIQFVDDFAL
jgi:anti-anti-sigma regulatory factor